MHLTDARTAWSGDVPLAGLPQPLSGLVGRERELDLLHTLIGEDASPLVTLTGFGGIGKTRLAIAAAHALAPRFDQVQFLPLVTVLDAEAVPGIIAARLGLRDAGVVGVRAALEESFSRHHTLLVLDNLEHLPGMRAVVADLLTSPGSLQIIATSRLRLRLPGEVVLAVEPLPVGGIGGASAEEVPSSTQLFLQRVREHHPGFVVTAERLADIDVICAELEGLPLAIELAAARCRIMAPRELRARLQGALDLLVGDSAAQAEHQQTMRRTIAWSVDLLDGQSRDLFEQVAAFGSPVDEPAVASMLGVDDVAVRQMLEHLVEHHLLVPDRTLPELRRYRFPAAIGEFAAECLELRADRDAVRARMAAHTHDFVRRATEGLRGPEVARWTRHLDVAMGSIVRAMAWLEAHGDVERLADILIWMQPHWLVRGRYDITDDWLERALTLVGTGQGPSPGRQNGLLVSGSRMALGRGDIERARSLIQQAKPDEMDLWERAKTAEQRGVVELRAGQYFEAIEQFERARAVSQTLGNAEAEAWSLLGMATAWLDLGALEQADQALTQARACYETVGSAQGMALVSDSWSQVLHGQGRTREALVQAETALDLFREAANHRRAGLALDSIGRYARELGDFERAREAHLAALARYREAGDPSNLVAWLQRVMALMAATGAQEHASALLRPVASLEERYGRRISRLELRELEQLQSTISITPDLPASLPERVPRRGPSLDDAVASAEIWLTTPIVVTSVPDVDRTALGKLTRREREIVSLVAEGLTDQQIADRLGISIRTVGKHLSTAYGRLGVNSRREAARFVVRD